MNATNTTTTPAVTPYTFENKPINIVVDEQGQPWFNANDVCGVLEYVNPRLAVKDHVDVEDVSKRYTLSAGGKQLTNHINESGLYALIFGSTKPEAKRFKKWVTSEVLPSIRKTGTYTAPVEEEPRTPRDLQIPLTVAVFYRGKEPEVRTSIQSQHVAYLFNRNHRQIMHRIRMLSVESPHQFNWTLDKIIHTETSVNH